MEWPWLSGEPPVLSMTPEYVERIRAEYGLDDEAIDFIRSKQVDIVTQEAIMNAEQRSDLWHESRSGRLTASNYGSAAGHNKFCTPKALAKDMLWPSFQGNAATQWGVDHEDVAATAYENYMKLQHGEQNVEVSFPGLIVSLEFPWVGSSPDGFVWIDRKLAGGLEIKCPFKRELYPCIPPYYYDQIQGTMGFLNMQWWDFVVWTPNKMQISRFTFDKTYFDTVLFPRMESFYMRIYLPAALLKSKGLLAEGQIVQQAEALDVFEAD